MKARKTVALALVAGLGVVGGTVFANAQAQAPQTAPAPATDQTPGGPGPGWGPGMGMGGHYGWGMGYGMGAGSRMSKEDRTAFFDARIAAIHAGLRLTPEQEKLWPTVETAVRSMVKTMSEAYDKRRAAGAPKDPMEGMRSMADMQIARGEAMKKIVDAASPLYATLTPEQKARLPMLAHAGMRERMGGWMRDHGMRWGWGRDRDDDRPRHWRRDDGPRGSRYGDDD
jgi:zinc resistance-associated protein